MAHTRRTFVWNAAAWSAGAVLAVPPATTKGFFANDAVQIGLIGFGGRCRQLLRALKLIPSTRITAVCDVWDVNRRAGEAAMDSDVFSTRDHHALLERSDVDAVLIATPDHWHVPMTIDACRAKKDVFVEKPLTHDLSEGAAVIAAQDENKAVVQVGTQQRSMPHLQEAREIVASGQLGKVHKCRLTWNRNVRRGWVRPDVDPNKVDWKRFLGNAPDQPFDSYRFREWRWFWDFGGGLFTDLMVHWMDVVHWCLDLNEPASAASIGDRFFPNTNWETPDTVQTLLRFPEANLQVHFEGTFVNHRSRAMTEFMGTEATLYMDRGRYEIHPEKPDGQYRERILGAGERGLDFYDQPDAELLHLTDWIDAIRARRKPRCPAEAGVKSAASAHLANRSLRSGQIAYWNS